MRSLEHANIIVCMYTIVCTICILLSIYVLCRIWRARIICLLIDGTRHCLLLSIWHLFLSGAIIRRTPLIFHTCSTRVVLTHLYFCLGRVVSTTLHLSKYMLFFQYFLINMYLYEYILHTYVFTCSKYVSAYPYFYIEICALLFLLVLL